jgi:tRNA(Ile)-lysidine synthase
VTALTVDHGLRPESGAEARRVKAWLSQRGIPHRVLRWTAAGEGRMPGANLQALARAARYRLLAGWCRKRHVLHLLLAHHLEDQAETFLLRLGRGSGIHGLAAMAAVTGMEAVRLLRPLLTVPKARLRANLQRRGQAWIEDPSNQDPAFARVRLRALMPAFAEVGMDAQRLAQTANAMGRARRALEEAAVTLLAGAAEIYPAGYCLLRPDLLGAAPDEVALRALARILTCVGGAVYPPRFDRLERLHRALAEGRLTSARTLGGCRIGPAGDDRLLVSRERAAMSPPVPVVAGGTLRWDGRFVVELGTAAKASGEGRGRGGKGVSDAVLDALGRRGWAEIAGVLPQLRSTPIPPPVRSTLPALKDGKGVLSVPHLGYRRRSGGAGNLWISGISCAPAQPLAGAGFTVV